MIINRPFDSVNGLTKAEAHEIISTVKPFTETDNPPGALADWLNQ